MNRADSADEQRLRRREVNAANRRSRRTRAATP
jgi:hypothetical protein